MRKLSVNDRAYSRCRYYVGARHQVPDFELAVDADRLQRGDYFGDLAAGSEWQQQPLIFHLMPGSVLHFRHRVDWASSCDAEMVDRHDRSGRSGAHIFIQPAPLPGFAVRGGHSGAFAFYRENWRPLGGIDD